VSLPVGYRVSSDALEQWRAEGGERLTYSEVAWVGASVAVVLHASLSFFSVVIAELEAFLVVFAPAQRFAFALTEGLEPLARWLALLCTLSVWGALVAVASLAAVHEVTDLVRRLIRR
jgi:hypothetical protein